MAKQRSRADAGKLRLEYIDPADLKKNPRNWRLHPETQMRALSAVMEEVGWAGALLYNERTERLIDGAARKELFEGKGKVPVLIGSWDEATEKKILATLDPLGAMAEANEAALASLQAEIGSDSDALNQLLAQQGDEEIELKQLDTRPPPKMSWVLIGIPTARFGEIAAAVEGLAAIPEIILETTSNDGPKDG
jgi:hypothetical protein